MIVDHGLRTRCIITDDGMVPKYVGGLTRGKTGLVVDQDLGVHRDKLLAGDLKGSAVLELSAAPVTVETLRKVGSFLRENGLQTVVGLGGGSILDAVKLAVLFTADPALTIFAERHARRSGLLVLPPITNPKARPKTILMPSTVGTGAEVSAVACLDTAVGRRLIASRNLAGDVAVLDAGHLATLPQCLVFEGLLEALLRVAGTMVGSQHSIFDDDGHVLIQRIVRLGERLMLHDAPELRLTAARLSMETHTGWALIGRNPYGARHWYLANELAYVTGTRKMTATASVIGPIWEEIAHGAAAWGDHGRLRQLWSMVTEVVPDLDPEPAPGINDLMRRWGISGIETIGEATLLRTTEAAIRNWGGALPMLRGIDAVQIHHVLTAAARGHHVLSGPKGDLRAGKREEVST
ncbi:daptide-type RiPP biosynthesis dehydogenase [Arthrobacter sp. ISL-95]|uniref:daptide-type RiPP biosynthesis dehydogenase n=1 Tax=Arthrobacter sp. ISL-95 TaxID=2819116 RepID=UPI001BEBD55B|nr:daptide-type RiPP biosynthesis dehydogenase [Arthrobacter sp. ISL-95]MBT2586672.1 iron-containing alcohol dehydrogenase [Arthrobacter sp. ISL-95]